LGVQGISPIVIDESRKGLITLSLLRRCWGDSTIGGEWDWRAVCGLASFIKQISREGNLVGVSMANNTSGLVSHIKMAVVVAPIAERDFAVPVRTSAPAKATGSGIAAVN
jgi:hypothetical protein